MAAKVRDLLTTDPIIMEGTQSARTAAEKMREADVGALLVEEYGTLVGIVTDRDLVTRVIAQREDADSMTMSSVVSAELHTVGPDDSLADAVKVMQEHAVRRVPVVEDGTAIGILSLGDVALALDPDSVLADISKAKPNT